MNTDVNRNIFPRATILQMKEHDFRLILKSFHQIKYHIQDITEFYVIILFDLFRFPSPSCNMIFLGIVIRKVTLYLHRGAFVN